MKRDIYADVATRILSQLEAGTVPWVKPWRATAGANQPCNAATGRPYSGANVVLLWMATQANGWTSPRFVTFKQALELGGNVRKGEHGTKVYFVKQLAVRDSDAAEGEERRVIPMLREYTVFNVGQCENLPARVVEPGAAPKARNVDERDTIADEFLASTGAEIKEGYGEAYYAPGADFISMPSFASSKAADRFYDVAFHELAHWTGHKSRLARDFRGRFGDEHYAAEELVAELTSAFLSAEFGFDGADQSAAYIASWRRVADRSRAANRGRTLRLPATPQRDLSTPPSGRSRRAARACQRAAQ